MFKWIKKLFCIPKEQSCCVIHFIYDIEPFSTVAFDEIKPKRKYTKRKKTNSKTKRRKK